MNYWKLGMIEHEERVRQNTAPRPQRDIHYGKRIRAYMAWIIHWVKRVLAIFNNA